MYYYLSSKDYGQISNYLIEFHELFYKFWSVGRPHFTDKVPTAAVTFDKKGKFLQFIFNRDFWLGLTNYERAFIIAHECMHLILNHGQRALSARNQTGNVAIDIAANNILTNKLGLKLTDKLREGCHISTVFKDTKNINKSQSFEYYYNLINNNPQNVNKNLQCGDHDYLSGMNIDELLDHIFDTTNIPIEEKKEIKEKVKKSIRVGTEPLNEIYQIYTNIKKIKKINWQFLLKNIVKSQKSKIMKEFYGPNWIKKDRRTALLGSNMIIPSYNNEKPTYKTEMWFMQDCSGSCIHLKDKFIQVARQIDTNIFDVKFHIFDTLVKEQDIKKNTIEAGGGTSFSCIEKYIQNKIKKENRKYPKMVVVISDGDGDIIHPEQSKNWIWILTRDNRQCIPVDSKIVVMNDLDD